LDAEVHRPEIIETTALGAAYMAGLQQGLFSSLEEISEKWQLQQAFKPAKDESWREQQYQGWQEAVARTRSQG
jgi:glycerol kinase